MATMATMAMAKPTLKGRNASRSEVLLELRDVHKSFGTKTVLQGCSFQVRRGEAVGIIGPSGTGKSTVLKVLAGLLAPDDGDVLVRGNARKGLVDDEDVSKKGPQLRIGMVFQSAALFDSLTVGENVGFALREKDDRLEEEKVKQLVAKSLSSVGLSGVEEKYPAQLSGGMKKRVALARAIIGEEEEETEEEVVMYDEPTAGLDPIASTVVEDLIRSVHNKGGASGVSSYVVVTHQYSTIRRAVDRLVFLHEGKVAWEGTSAEFDTCTVPIVRQFATGSLDGPIQYS